MRYIFAILISFIVGVSVHWCNVPERAAVVADAAPTATAEPTRAQPLPTATVTPWVVVSEPVRVQFPIGSYGTTTTTDQPTAYLLWARAGQRMKIAPALQFRVYGPNGDKLQLSQDGNIFYLDLPANGDYTVEVGTDQSVDVAFEIR